MKIVKLRDQNEAITPSCGILRNILHSKKFGLVRFDNIGITGRHYHRKLEEIYYSLKGSITVEVKEKKSKLRRLIKLNTHDTLLIHPGDIHKIVKTSKKNSLLVFCIPDWQEKDEILVTLSK